MIAGSVGAGLKPAPARLRFKKDCAIFPGPFPAISTASVHLSDDGLPDAGWVIIFGFAAIS